MYIAALWDGYHLLFEHDHAVWTDLAVRMDLTLRSQSAMMTKPCLPFIEALRPSQDLIALYLCQRLA